MPQTGPVLLCVRHVHHLFDGVGLLAFCPRDLHILVGLDWVSSAAERFVMETLTSWAGWPVTLRQAELEDCRRERPSAFRLTDVRPYQLHSFRMCMTLLGDQRVVAVFPEGFPVVDPHTPRERLIDQLAPFQPGVARLACSAARRFGADVSVVPVGIQIKDRSANGMIMNFGAAHIVTAETEPELLLHGLRRDVTELSQ